MEKVYMISLNKVIYAVFQFKTTGKDRSSVKAVSTLMYVKYLC